MNTKKIQQTQIKNMWGFPQLSDGKKGRIVTKHFCNLAFLLPPNQFSLLSFLIYQSAADNTVIYSTGLLKTYQLAVIKGSERYNSKNEHLNISLPRSRKYFGELINNSLLLPTNEPKVFLINPNLTFSKVYLNSKFYYEWVERYNCVYTNRGVGEKYVRDSNLVLAGIYTDHIAENFSKRKINK